MNARLGRELRIDIENESRNQEGDLGELIDICRRLKQECNTISMRPVQENRLNNRSYLERIRQQA